jgi:hypothetical protein
MSLRVPNAPGHLYVSHLRCGFCDYVLEIRHTGPNYDRGKWKLQLRACPECKKRGITSFMEPSNK